MGFLQWMKKRSMLKLFLWLRNEPHWHEQRRNFYERLKVIHSFHSLSDSFVSFLSLPIISILLICTLTASNITNSFQKLKSFHFFPGSWQVTAFEIINIWPHTLFNLLFSCARDRRVLWWKYVCCFINRVRCWRRKMGWSFDSWWNELWN